jgi:hypothetical protein
LVFVQVRRAFLQVHRPSVRVRSEPDVLHSTNGTPGPKAKATVSSSRVLGRLPDMSRQGQEGSQYEGLPEGDTSDRQAALIIRFDTASDEGRMGREYSGGTPWLRDRLGSHAFLYSAAKNIQGAWYRAGYPPASTERASVGFECSAARTNVVLRIVMSTITVVCLVSSLPLYFYTMTSHRDIYIYKC